MRALRVSAIVVLVAALAVTGWLALGAPWFARADDMLRDPFYRIAHARALLPFAGAVAGIALVVTFAARTAMARRRLAATGLWSILTGGVLMLVSAGLEMTPSVFGAFPRRVETLDRVKAGWAILGLGGGGALLMVLGVLLWLIARFTGRRPA